MSLDKYQKIRNFEKTDEPKGEIFTGSDELIFVVQKHKASRLHYDLRLECNGVLLSWAVPKGLSLNPEHKHLAIQTEDHPYAYKDFEGNIPKGNYGAGKMIVWDTGTYTVSEKYSGNINTKVHNDIAKGKLSFLLKGKKLQGEFTLVKIKNSDKGNWLVFKNKDAFADKIDILESNKSVLSNVTLEELEITNAKDISSNSEIATAIGSVQFVKPMLAKTKKDAFDDSDWIFETKYDGYRIIATLDNHKVELFSRNHNSYTEKFKSITNALMQSEHSAILDGEVVILNSSGFSDFQTLQKSIKKGEGNYKYYIFDILNLDGNTLTDLPLLQRKELVKLFISKLNSDSILYSEHSNENGTELFQFAIDNKLEGIIAKKSDSKYEIGNRSDNWLKIKIHNQLDAIVIGITESLQSRNYFGSLLLAQYDGKKLRYIGKCGSGFSEDSLQNLHEQFSHYFTPNSPIEEKITIREKIQWIMPHFIVDVKFTEWTVAKHLRHPIFLNLRKDKDISEVALDSSELSSDDASKLEIPDNYTYQIGKISLELTNQNKIFFPEINIIKAQMIAYYDAISEYILPYLKNRPQSLNRFPNGITRHNFYQKNTSKSKIPTWLTTYEITSDNSNKKIEYLLCNDKQTLLYMVNLGCIDFNPWNSTTAAIDKPDWMVIDIDPAIDDFDNVIKVALLVKEVMDELDTSCYCKTSGATGLHVYIPLKRKYYYETVKIFAELIATEVHFRCPDISTLERSISKRNNKIYIDYLQNRMGQTIAAPYSLRPTKDASVSTPLDWSEVNSTLRPENFTIYNTIARCKEKGDIWKAVLGKGANLNNLLKKLEKIKSR
jgi:bifunctional non-homologous end joining protein LigD